jgi:hypothetical protein
MPEPTIGDVRDRWPFSADFDWLDLSECSVLHSIETAGGWLLAVGTRGAATCEWVYWPDCRQAKPRYQHSNEGFCDLAVCVADGLNAVVGSRGEDADPDAFRWEPVEETLLDEPAVAPHWALVEGRSS